MIKKKTKLPNKVKIIAYDLEWDRNFNVTLVTVWDENGGRYYDTVEAFIYFELQKHNKGAWFYAHSGGIHDVQFLLNFVLKNPSIKVNGWFSGSSLVIVDFNVGGNRFRFVDSFQLLRDKLAKIGEAIGLKKLEDIGFATTDRSELIKYGLRDSEIVYVAVSKFQDLVNSFGADLKTTIASTAHDVVCSRFLKKDIPTVGAVNKTLEEWFFGGRVEVFRQGKIDGKVYGYDINSSYPYAMTNNIPGKFIKAVKKIPNDDTPYIAKVTIDIPDYIERPPLPVRLGKNRRLYFPCGQFTGYWCKPELEYALNIGCSIVSIHDVMIFEKATFLSDFAHTFYNMRKSAPNGSAEKIIFKYLLNSAYGKFGQKEECTRLVINPDTMPDERHQMIRLGVYSLKEYAKVEYRHIPIVTYITSIARANLAAHMDKASNVYYCDTDGFYCSDPNVSTSTDLGGLKLEKEAHGAFFAKPKLYWVGDQVKSKGFFGQDFIDEKGYYKNRDLTKEEFHSIINGNKVVMRAMCRPKGFLEKGHIFERVMPKGLTGNDTPKRVYYANGSSRPWSYDEILELEGLSA